MPAPPKVLVVDDNFSNLQAAGELLRSLDLEVELATSARPVINAASGGAYCLILMDCNLREMNGFEAAGLIRQKAGRKPTPIIAMVADDRADEKRYLQCGFDDVLDKPIERVAMMQMLSKWLPHVSSE